jgi:hypothetical protein
MAKWGNMQIARSVDGSDWNVQYETENDEILRSAAAPHRQKLLEEATKLTMGDRNREYGPPVENMQHIADIFNAITGHKISAVDVTVLHMATKLARMRTSPTHRDSHVDLMAYAGIRYECACAERVERADKI